MTPPNDLIDETQTSETPTSLDFHFDSNANANNNNNDDSDDYYSYSSQLSLPSQSPIGNMIHQASQILTDLENDQDGIPRLGHAIRRYANELADLVKHVAHDLEFQKLEQSINKSSFTQTTQTTQTLTQQQEDHQENQEKLWAQAIIQDAKLQIQSQSQSQSQLEGESFINNRPSPHCQQHSAAVTISTMDEQDIINAITSARFILLDIEEALRNISKDDAEEIADASLVVARLFLWALQNVHHQITTNIDFESETTRSINGLRTSSTINRGMQIEQLDDDFDENHNNHNNIDGKAKLKSIQHTGATAADTTRTNTRIPTHNTNQNQERIRLLWPPIGPAVISLASWGKDEATKQPILSIAIALALWPTALILAFIGIPLLAFDITLQSGYDVFQDQEIIQNMEKGAANLVQIAKLYFLISKLFLKQSIRVGKRQIERKGGVQKIVQEFGFWTLERIRNPIESFSMAFNTMKTGTGMAFEAACFVKDTVTTAATGGGGGGNGNQSAHHNDYYSYHLSV